MAIREKEVKMGEAKRRRMMGNGTIPMMIPKVGGQVQPFDISEAVPKRCICGCEYYDKVMRLGLISAIAPKNLTGQEIRVEFPTYLCRKCGHEFGKPVVVQQ